MRLGCMNSDIGSNSLDSARSQHRRKVAARHLDQLKTVHTSSNAPIGGKSCAQRVYDLPQKDVCLLLSFFLFSDTNKKIATDIRKLK